MSKSVSAGTTKSGGQSGFKGNKQSLPQKPCHHCGKPMVWRKAWAKNWEEVKYCSDRCRSDAKRGQGAGQGGAA